MQIFWRRIEESPADMLSGEFSISLRHLLMNIIGSDVLPRLKITPDREDGIILSMISPIS